MLLKLTEAFDHIRLPANYPPEQVLPYLLAAESSVQAFCQRQFFTSAEKLNEARTAIPSSVRDAANDYDEAVLLANEIEDLNERNAAIAVACRIRESALTVNEQALWGMVITDDVKAAILLQMEHLFENRSENITGSIVSELKTGVAALLWPYRVRVGV